MTRASHGEARRSGKALRNGETSVRVHFQGQVEVVRFTMPHPTTVAPEQFAARQNAIDEPVFAKLAALHVPPSPACTDEVFIRRASLDTIGTLPTADEVTAFLADTRPEKRALLVEALLARPEWDRLLDAAARRSAPESEGARSRRARHERRAGFSRVAAQAGGGKSSME
jgi:hypothetical protein